MNKYLSDGKPIQEIFEWFKVKCHMHRMRDEKILDVIYRIKADHEDSLKRLFDHSIENFKKLKTEISPEELEKKKKQMIEFLNDL